MYLGYKFLESNYKSSYHTFDIQFNPFDYNSLQNFLSS